MATTTINFPIHTKLNPEGKWTKLERNGSYWSLLNPTTKQRRRLGQREFTDALKAVVEPQMT